MGNCIADEEDVGDNTDASMQKAVSQDVESIDDAALLGALGKSAGLKQKLILNMKCLNLPNMDKRSNTDAFCILWQMKGKNHATK